MGATCALSAGNHQFDAAVKVRQNVRMLVSTNFDRHTTLPSGPHPTHNSPQRGSGKTPLPFRRLNAGSADQVAVKTRRAFFVLAGVIV